MTGFVVTLIVDLILSCPDAEIRIHRTLHTKCVLKLEVAPFGSNFVIWPFSFPSKQGCNEAVTTYMMVVQGFNVIYI